MIKKLHPDICFMVFDIPPQLYVCEQYLSAVFPDSVVSYRETRENGFVPEPERGGIFIMGNWKFPVLESMDVDLFWNALSFQEMEPNVVANYLSYVNRLAEAVYLYEYMGGQKLAKQRGDTGVIEKTTSEHYKNGLANFELVHIASSQGPIPALGSAARDSFWRRKGHEI